MFFKKGILILTFAIAGTTLIALGGCGQFQRAWTNFTGNVTYKCVVTNIVYVQSDSGLAPLLDIEGKTVPCNKLKEL